ncbi:MAG: hypothetical protein FJ356_06460 [Thaumarchaeota archaeon]|nr:hypothetical protein [Nitrososphaerota archaeon]
MRYIKPKRLKLLMILFFGTAGWGIIYGLYGPNPNLMIVFLGVVNLCLGGLFGYVFLTQEPRLRDKRKE